MQLDFADPWWLLLLPMPVFWFVLRRRISAGALRHSSITLFTGIPSAKFPVIAGRVLRLTALLAATLALAGPRLPDRKSRLPADGIAILFLLDVSGSMEEPTFAWDAASGRISRREAAKRAFLLFVAGGTGPDGIEFEGRSNERGTDAIGLVTFSTWPEPVCPPTQNHAVLLDVLERIRPASPKDIATNIGDAIAEGIARVEKLKAKRKVLILLSDGEHNLDLADPDRRPFKPRQAASLAANLGIPIYTIDAGGSSEDADPETQKQRLDGQRVNRVVAEMTGGRSFTANDGEQLRDVCRQIDALERQPILSPVYRRYFEFRPWLALIAFGAAVAIASLELTRWHRMK
jgi:Ca-activated chloride channel homolog